MAFRRTFILLGTILLTFNITEFECSKKSKGNKNRTLADMYGPAMHAITEFPLGISDVFDDASDVFRKILGKMIAKKKLVGLDSGWYW